MANGMMELSIAESLAEDRYDTGERFTYRIYFLHAAPVSEGPCCYLHFHAFKSRDEAEALAAKVRKAWDATFPKSRVDRSRHWEREDYLTDEDREDEYGAFGHAWQREREDEMTSF